MRLALIFILGVIIGYFVVTGHADSQQVLPDSDLTVVSCDWVSQVAAGNGFQVAS
jgi:hypothetical protein